MWLIQADNVEFSPPANKAEGFKLHSARYVSQGSDPDPDLFLSMFLCLFLSEPRTTTLTSRVRVNRHFNEENKILNITIVNIVFLQADTCACEQNCNIPTLIQYTLLIYGILV